MEWCMSDVFKLINLYRQFECLWNFKSASYKRIDLKNNAWLQISKEFRKDISEVKKKIKNLRTAYLAEKKKVDCSKKSGSSTDFIHEPNLFYYNEMNFLDAVVMLRRTTSNFEDNKLKIAGEAIDLDSTLTEDTSEVFVMPMSSPSPSNIIITSSSSSGNSSPSSSPAITSLASSSSGSRPFSKQKTRIQAKFNSAVDAIIASAKGVETENVFSSFGKAIALQLQQLPLADATLTMSEIHNHVTQKLLAHLSTSEQANDRRDIMQTAIEGADICLY